MAVRAPGEGTILDAAWRVLCRIVMMKHTSIRLRSSLLAIGIVLLATDAQVFAVPVPGPPQIKDAPGGLSVCVAIRRNGAPILGGAIQFGHIAWGVEVSRGRYMFGSLENPRGDSPLDPGRPNGGWFQFGTFSDMQNAFRDPALRRSNPAHAGQRYDEIQCVALARPDVDRAQSSGRSMPGRGYRFPGNTCLDAVDNVIRAYGAPGLPSPTFTPAPNDYYDRLRWPRSVKL